MPMEVPVGTAYGPGYAKVPTHGGCSSCAAAWAGVGLQTQRWTGSGGNPGGVSLAVFPIKPSSIIMHGVGGTIIYIVHVVGYRLWQLPRSLLTILLIRIHSLLNVFCIDEHLTVILDECYDVSEWKILGLAIGIVEADLNRIEESNLNALRRQTAMFAMWFDSDKASWRNLVKSLLYPPLKAQDIAKTVAKNNPKL